MGKDKSTAGKKVAEAARAAQTAQAAKQKTSSPEAKPGSSSVSARPTSQREKGSAVDQENAGAENNRDDASQGDAESSGEDDSSQGKVESYNDNDDTCQGGAESYMGSVRRNHRHRLSEESNHDEFHGDQSSDFGEEESSQRLAAAKLLETESLSASLRNAT